MFLLANRNVCFGNRNVFLLVIEMFEFMRKGVLNLMFITQVFKILSSPT